MASLTLPKITNLLLRQFLDFSEHNVLSGNPKNPMFNFSSAGYWLSYGNCETPLWDAHGLCSANSLKVLQLTPHNTNLHPALKTHNCTPGIWSRVLHGKLPICRANRKGPTMLPEGSSAQPRQHTMQNGQAPWACRGSCHAPNI